MKKKEILVVGSGFMAEEYLKVLKGLELKAIIVGRGSYKVKKLEEKFPEFTYFSGGLQNFLESNISYPKTAINTTNIEFLRNTTELLLNAGINKILLEKPGDLTISGLLKLDKLAIEKNAELYIAYNRRFYSSIIELIKQTELDGGIISTHFEFTEWIHTIDPTLYNNETLNKWVIANSSHVIDTVFHLIGIPKSMNCLVNGQDVIPWHTSGSVFIGLGISQKDIPFSYHTNWQAPGRWSIEILTKKRRFYLKPMEILQVQNIGSVSLEQGIIDDKLDKLFKPGLFLQTKTFIDGEYSKLCTLKEQIEKIDNFYNKMSGYL